MYPPEPGSEGVGPSGATRDATFIVGPLGTIEYADDAACGLVGYSEEDLVGLHGAELICPEDRAATAVTLDRMRRHHLASSWGRLRRKDGALVTVEVRARALPDRRLVLTLRAVEQRIRV